jgi:hypothetical protein
LAWPALEPGRLLKTCSDVRRRGMTVLDRTRLTDRLSNFLPQSLLLNPRLSKTKKILLLTKHFKFKAQPFVLARFCLGVAVLFSRFDHAFIG